MQTARDEFGRVDFKNGMHLNLEWDKLKIPSQGVDGKSGPKLYDLDTWFEMANLKIWSEMVKSDPKWWDLNIWSEVADLNI